MGHERYSPVENKGVLTCDLVQQRLDTCFYLVVGVILISQMSYPLMSMFFDRKAGCKNGTKASSCKSVIEQSAIGTRVDLIKKRSKRTYTS